MNFIIIIDFEPTHHVESPIIPVNVENHVHVAKGEILKKPTQEVIVKMPHHETCAFLEKGAVFPSVFILLT